MAGDGKPRLMVDVDNVLSASDPVFRELARRVTCNRVSLEQSDVIFYDYADNKDPRGNSITRDEWHLMHREFLVLGPGDWPPPVPGAIEGLRVLSEKFAIVVATARPPEGRSITADWVDEHLAGIKHELYFSGHRGKHRMGSLAAAIEDDYDQAAMFTAAGITCLLLRYPWNVDPVRCPPSEGICWCDDWAAAVARLMYADGDRGWWYTGEIVRGVATPATEESGYVERPGGSPRAGWYAYENVGMAIMDVSPADPEDNADGRV